MRGQCIIVLNPSFDVMAAYERTTENIQRNIFIQKILLARRIVVKVTKLKIYRGKEREKRVQNTCKRKLIFFVLGTLNEHCSLIYIILTIVKSKHWLK